jgi:imidazolonepropionase-like amidohydrolase
VTVRRGRPLAALGTLVAALACRAGGDVVALRGATLLDGSGAAPRRGAVVVVRNGHVAAVDADTAARIPRGARVIDLAGQTVIPGLIDAHAHVERWAAERYLAWGVTAVRDLGAAGTDSLIALKHDFDLGGVLGPRMFTSGAMLDGSPPAHAGATVVQSAAEVRRAVDRLAVVGADAVKIFTGFPPALLPALHDEAAALRLPVAAHLGTIDALAAARAGVSSIEHMSGVVAAAAPGSAPALSRRASDRFFAGWAAEERGWATLDSGAVARVARSLAASRVAVVPTLVLHELWARLDNPTLATRPGMDDVPAAATSVRDVAGFVRRSGWGPEDFAAFRRGRARQDQFVREFVRAGGLVAAGSDAANPLLAPGVSLHEELGLLVAAGLPPLQALAAATGNAARLLGADSLGRIAPGAVADLVVLDADPTADIAATRRIAWVMVRGRIIRPDSLRSTWGK